MNKHGVSGLLSPVGDVEHMTANALEILGSEASLERFRKGALSEAAKFSVDRILPLYEGLYDEVLAELNGK